MQSSLIRAAHRPLAWLTLCAIVAPTSTAWAEPARTTIDSASRVAKATDSEPGASIASLALPGLSPAWTADAQEPAAQESDARETTARPSASHPLPPPPPAAPPPDDGAGLRTVGFVAGGVGLAGLVLFAIAGLGAKSAYDKLDTDCGSTPCTDEAHRSDIEGGRMLQTTANLGLALGLTGLGVGATLLVLGSRSPLEKREPSASASANGAMITYGGQF